MKITSYSNEEKKDNPQEFTVHIIIPLYSGQFHNDMA